MKMSTELLWDGWNDHCRTVEKLIIKPLLEMAPQFYDLRLGQGVVVLITLFRSNGMRKLISQYVQTQYWVCQRYGKTHWVWLQSGIAKMNCARNWQWTSWKTKRMQTVPSFYSCLSVHPTPAKNLLGIPHFTRTKAGRKGVSMRQK